jgi:NADH-quinone oxidoreductase subunit L
VLWVLAIGSMVTGFAGFPLALVGIHKPTWFQSWLEPILLPLGEEAYHFHVAPLGTEVALILGSIAVAVVGILFARSFYGTDPAWSKPKRIAESWPGVYRVVANKYFVDEIYGATVIRGTLVFSYAMAWVDTYIIDGLVNLVRYLGVYLFGNGSNAFDKFVVDGAVNGVAAGAKRSSIAFRRLQTGAVQNYALIMGSGLVLFVAVYLFLKP